jgi:regulator of replication initiation timing
MRLLPIGLAALTMAACDRSKAELEKTLAQVQQVSAEKDSLLKDVMQTSQFIAEVNAELARVRSRAAGRPVRGGEGDLESGLTPSQQREAIKLRVKELADRLNESESRLTASRNRVRELSANNAAMARQLAAYDSTIAAFKSIIDNQKTEIASLQEQVGALTTENKALKTENVQLAGEKMQLTEEKTALTKERNTVYYVIGRADDLVKQGVLDRTGGFLGMGKTQVPARDLNPAVFTSIDKTQVTEIPFPRADRPYRIVTRQDVGGLETTPDKDGRIRGGLKIKDVERFWAASKFLIVVEQ